MHAHKKGLGNFGACGSARARLIGFGWAQALRGGLGGAAAGINASEQLYLEGEVC